MVFIYITLFLMNQVYTGIIKNNKLTLKVLKARERWKQDECLFLFLFLFFLLA
jgi:hypothetical protein